VRRIRELVGHGEWIMGIADSFAATSFHPVDELWQIEHLCVDWRWRLKGRKYRQGQVHETSILGTSYSGTARISPCWIVREAKFGDPADDVACLSMKYGFFSLERSGRLEGAFEVLFLRFWQLNRYCGIDV
jgi:hypothetical protein